jgi:DNA replication protein DnaC
MPCEFCDDTGWKPIEQNGIRRVVRCDCRRAKVGQERLADSNIPKRYQHCTIDNFAATNRSNAPRSTPLRRGRISVVSRGLFLEGQPGVGKRTWP